MYSINYMQMIKFFISYIFLYIFTNTLRINKKYVIVVSLIISYNFLKNNFIII